MTDAHGLLLGVHGWLRWAAVLGALGLGGRALHGARRGRRWTGGDQLALRLFAAAADLQFLLGLLLYLEVSPVSRAAVAVGLRASVEQPALLFFGFVHPLLMVVATGAAHVARARARRAPDDAGRFRTLAGGAALWLLLVAAAIPWPGLPYGRPLVRGLGP